MKRMDDFLNERVRLFRREVLRATAYGDRPMTNTSSTITDVLKRFDAFKELDPSDLSWLASRVRPFQCNPGQELLSAKRLPEFCYAIVEGRGRVLHDDPGLQRPVTLAYSRPGDLVGWAGLARRQPCEWITSISTMRLIGISADDFFELERKSSSFRNWLDITNSPAELMAALAPAFRKRPMAKPSEREVLHRLLPGVQLVPARNLRTLPDDNAIWLWNAVPDGVTLPTGEQVSQTF